MSTKFVHTLYMCILYLMINAIIKLSLNVLRFSPGHDIKLYTHRVKLYQIGCVGFGHLAWY